MSIDFKQARLIFHDLMSSRFESDYPDCVFTVGLSGIDWGDNWVVHPEFSDRSSGEPVRMTQGVGYAVDKTTGDVHGFSILGHLEVFDCPTVTDAE